LLRFSSATGVATSHRLLTNEEAVVSRLEVTRITPTGRPAELLPIQLAEVDRIVAERLGAKAAVGA
jgi:hypothetical protein